MKVSNVTMGIDSDMFPMVITWLRSKKLQHLMAHAYQDGDAHMPNFNHITFRVEGDMINTLPSALVSLAEKEFKALKDGVDTRFDMQKEYPELRFNPDGVDIIFALYPHSLDALERSLEQNII